MAQYQGWTNYETWAVGLWVDNDEGLYHEKQSLVRSHRDDPGKLAEALKEWITNMAPDLGATLWADLVTTAIGEVNWDELAAAWLAE